MFVPIYEHNIEDTLKSFTKDSAQEIQDIIQGLYLHPLLKAKVVHVPVETTKIYERVQVIADILQEHSFKGVVKIKPIQLNSSSTFSGETL